MTTLKGTQTEKNILTAFCGESQARNRYTYFSAQATLGFAKPGPSNPFAHPSAFGAPGTGGSIGFADPEARLGYGYIPNQMGIHLQDSREAALRKAMYCSIGEKDPRLV